MQTPRRTGRAVTDLRSHLWLWTAVAGGVASDLASKSLLWRHLGGPPETGGRVLDVLAGWLRLVASRNPGIVFGLEPGAWFNLGPGAGQAVTVVLTVLTAALIFYLFAVSDSDSRWTHLACGIILAGAFGNLYDRVAFGHVRDVFQFTAEVGGRSLWPFVFNAADVFLVVGVAFLAIRLLLTPHPDEAGNPEAPAEPSPDERA